LSARVPLWKKLEVVENLPAHIRLEEDECYYAREYTSGGGYAASEANNLITNFKIEPRHKNTLRWRHKEAAIQKFAEELALVITQQIPNLVIAPIPTSSLRTDPGFDHRLEATLATLGRLRPDLAIMRPLSFQQAITPSHRGGGRQIQAIAENLEWTDLTCQCDALVLVDDVLASGAHFRPCKQVVRQHVPGLRVVGFFWARTIWPRIDPAVEFGPLDPPGIGT
jgi:hypothetical protein